MIISHDHADFSKTRKLELKVRCLDEADVESVGEIRMTVARGQFPFCRALWRILWVMLQRIQRFDSELQGCGIGEDSYLCIPSDQDQAYLGSNKHYRVTSVRWAAFRFCQVQATTRKRRRSRYHSRRPAISLPRNSLST